MTKDAYIRITKLAPHPNRPYELVNYDPSWPDKFKVKEVLLHKLLGPEIIKIEHIGSTSIPGMSAKPQIDILVIVKDLKSIKNYYTVMKKAGFTPRGDYTGEGEEYFTEDTNDGKRKVSVHVLPQNHVWAEDLLNFRDYLREYPDEAMRYSKAKLQAARLNPGDYDTYFKTKHKMIEELRQKAANWKATIKLNKSAKKS